MKILFANFLCKCELICRINNFALLGCRLILNFNYYFPSVRPRLVGRSVQLLWQGVSLAARALSALPILTCLALLNSLISVWPIACLVCARALER